ncbi:ABC transporter ATP-binding protein [Listeria fleischmannii 1991]|uniref:Lipopolysaccharide export system ATP-binding protein LptB n=2 Tax=Listeria fleischmannii TaxID=1069827 RepID=A0A2X3J8W5_9LIST|nr:ABC transporter ATP-binding protein [Listeria fleischmannii]EMG27133.1 ABC transporter [Listeria fleischmannii subsp. fleischmannii LU2006-1]KMT59992.1 ABC transporter ATP-binding protein [Listeria fleischmannii 1991]SQC70660.1 Lipopolysaccharide export system ATP-binding protein LptB [Listeria fleischmannii subsp. fleischmannii]
MRVENIKKVIDEKIVLQNISFELKPGEITALIGRNGVGKTTLFSTMMGIFIPDEGKITIDGEDVMKNPSLKRKIFFLEDSMNYFNSHNVKTIVKLYRSIYTDFDEIYFQNLMNRFDIKMDTKIISFSKGRKALFFMILAFSLNVQYLLLDEPMDGLDVIIKREILDFILEQAKEKKTSVLIASHRLDELDEIADRVFILKGASLELDLYLEEFRQRTMKIQVAFKTKGVPDFVKNEAKLLYRNGQIYTIYVSEEKEEFLKRIKREQVILLEEMTMTIEDIFTFYLAEEKISYLEL